MWQTTCNKEENDIAESKELRCRKKNTYGMTCNIVPSQPLWEMVSERRMSGSKPAFTLAEVLITLGIIGVVAAMTMPSLINQTQNKELHTQFKKAYSELNQVSQKFYADEGITIPEFTSTYGIEPFMSKFMSYYVGASKTSGHTHLQMNILLSKVKIIGRIF